MKLNINFSNCPTASDFDMYLKGTGSNAFNQAFKEHLANCPLCSEAIEGYQLCETSPSVVDPLKKQKNILFNNRKPIHYLTWVSIAASILVIIGISSAIFNNTKQPVYSATADLDDNQLTSGLMSNTSSKGKLSNHLAEDYWYVCNQDIFINDQEVNPSDIDAIIEKIDPTKPLVIEVGCACDDRLDNLINKIKERKNVNIYTYSKESRIRPNRS